jgi:hypothetical protein
MGRVHSIQTTITLLRPKQCVCGYGYKRSRCNIIIKRLQCTWYYQITLRHKLRQPYNTSCFNVFGRRLKTMEVRSADCRVWNFFLKNRTHMRKTHTFLFIQNKLHWHIYRPLRGRTVSEKLPKIPLFGPSLNKKKSVCLPHVYLIFKKNQS